jgi:hypothetical protein
MRRTRSFRPLRWLSLLSLVTGVSLLVFQLITYSTIRAHFPSGMTIAGVPVGGLDRGQASQRLLEYYSQPIELHYGDSIILIILHQLASALIFSSMSCRS